MIHAHRVREVSGSPDIWITENVEDGRAKRTTWSVQWWNAKTVMVRIEDYAKIGGTSWRSTSAVEEDVPSSHRQAITREIRMDLCDRGKVIDVVFTDYDDEITAGTA